MSYFQPIRRPIQHIDGTCHVWVSIKRLRFWYRRYLRTKTHSTG